MREFSIAILLKKIKEYKTHKYHDLYIALSTSFFIRVYSNLIRVVAQNIKTKCYSLYS